MAFSHSMDEDKWPSGIPDCSDCDGAPPPFFNLPPPPCPPGLDVSMGLVPTSCPSALRSREEPLPQEQNLQLGVVFVTVGAMATLGTIVLLVFCGYRIIRSKGQKNSERPLHGAIIYDDLNSSPGLHPMSFYDPSRGNSPRGYKGLHGFPLGPKESPGSDTLSTTLYRYTPEPRRMGVPVEHLYSSISSGSGSEQCTGSTSDGASAEVRSLLPPQSSHSPAPTTTTDSEEEDSLTPFLRSGAPDDSDSQGPSPSHGRYYLNVPLTSLRPPPAGRTPFSSGPRKRNMTSSLTSMDRGLPLLPSRRDKFRIYSPQGTRGRRSQHLHQYAYSKPPGVMGGNYAPPTYDRTKIINRFSHIYQNA